MTVGKYDDLEKEVGLHNLRAHMILSYYKVNLDICLDFLNSKTSSDKS